MLTLISRCLRVMYPTNISLQAISAQIDAQMKPARRPTFRRGSKRYSITGLAADVAAMLGGKPSLERKSTLSQIDEQTGPIHTEIPRDIPTPARSDHTPSSRMSYAGSIRSFASEDAEDIKAREEMARINAEIMAEREAERAGIQQQINTPRSIHRVSPSSASIRSMKSEDPEDVRAREEMARINAEIMAAAAAAEEQARASATPKAVKRESDEDIRAREEVARLNAKIMEEERLSKQVQQVRAPQLTQVTSHQRLPTWVNQAKLAIVQGSHGVLRFGKEGADMKIVEARKVDEPTRAERSIPSLPQNVYSRPKHVLLPTWVDQATLPIVSGSHGVLKFGDVGASMAVVTLPQEVQPRSRGSKHEQLPTWADQSKLGIISGSWGMLAFRQGGADMVVVEAPREKVPMPTVAMHKHLPTWADQSKLAVVKGAWGMLVFRDGGADMEVVRVKESEEPEEQSPFSHELIRPLPAAAIVPEAVWFGKQDSLNGHPNNSTTRSISPDLTSHMPGNPKTREQGLQQQRLALPNGLGSVTMNHGHEKPKSAPEHTVAKVIVVEAVGEKYDLNHPALKELVQAVYTNGDLYWGADQAKLPIIRGSHGSLEFGQHGAELKAAVSANADRYWAGNQSTLPLVRGSHGSLKFGATGAAMKVVKIDPYWINQRTLVVVVGEHGFLTFEGNESVMQVRKRDPYWADQRTLRVVKGSHGRLVFGAGSAKMEIVRPDPYWVDQSTLALVTGAHGMLSFGEDGAALKVGDPYWVDQRTLPIVKGSHGRLIFDAVGAEMEVIRRDPYWEDQTTLSVVKGSHGKLTFTSNGAALEVVRPDPYWVDQSTLDVVEGDHGRLVFGPDGASVKVVRADPYWSADQTSLILVMGTHAMLKFDARGARMEIAGSKYSYWAANQVELKIVRGSHGVIVFNASGANLEIVAPKHPYWATNQASLEVVRGSHGMLVFNGSGASLVIANSYWTANQTNLQVVRGSHGILVFNAGGASLKVPRSLDAYWNANQTNLKVIQGSHGSLHFEDERATVHIIQPTPPYWTANQSILPIIQGSHGILVFNESGASVEVETLPAAYWTANQAPLEEVRGSHGTLHFTSEGSAYSVPEEKPIHRSPLPKQNPSSYQAEPAHLSPIQENHSTLIFNPSFPSIPHTTLQSLPTEASLETGDFFPDSSDSEEEVQFPLPPNRTSFDLGAFASLNVKDRVPLVTNLVGNGSYSSFDQDEDSPLTPTNDEHPSLVNQEAFIHSSPESSHHPHHQERGFRTNPVYEGGFEEREVKLSPLPTQFEFDPVFHQRVPVSVVSGRSPISTKPFESVSGSRLGSNNPFRKSMVAGEGGSVISRARAVFENGGKD